jgi:hypothetical protein
MRFLHQDALPVLAEHRDEFDRVQEQILRDLAADPEIRAAIRRGVGKIVSDPEAHRLVGQIAREAVVDNPRVRPILEKHWQSPRTQAAVNLAAQRLEPTIEQIGALLFGTPHGGVTPEFARVLRNQILFKDRRWLVLENATATVVCTPLAQQPPVLRVVRGRADEPSPFDQS